MVPWKEGRKELISLGNSLGKRKEGAMEYTDTLMRVLAQAEPAKKGLLSTNTVILLVVGLIVVAGVIYWYRGRGAK